jgi:hypothetical protein
MARIFITVVIVLITLSCHDWVKEKLNHIIQDPYAYLNPICQFVENPTIDVEREELLKDLTKLLEMPDSWENRGVAFFENADYIGKHKPFTVGNVAVIDSNWNDIISSVIVLPGCFVTVWENSNFHGDSKTFTSSATWIGSAFNDKISSLKVECDF